MNPFIADASPIRYRVQMKAGGAIMQVCGVVGELLHCWWINCRGDVAQALIPRGNLRLLTWRT